MFVYGCTRQIKRQRGRETAKGLAFHNFFVFVLGAAVKNQNGRRRGGIVLPLDDDQCLKNNDDDVQTKGGWSAWLGLFATFSPKVQTPRPRLARPYRMFFPAAPFSFEVNPFSGLAQPPEHGMTGPRGNHNPNHACNNRPVMCAFLTGSSCSNGFRTWILSIECVIEPCFCFLSAPRLVTFNLAPFLLLFHPASLSLFVLKQCSVG